MTKRANSETMDASRTLLTSFLVFSCLLGIAAAATVAWDDHNKNQTAATWAEDIFQLPANVPFPGAKWLDRVSTPESAFVAPNGVEYSSIYAAILENDPVQNPCRNINAWLNSIFFSPQTAAAIANAVTGILQNNLVWTHYFITYLRNLICGAIVYYGTAGVFHYFCYVHPKLSQEIFGDELKPRRLRPTAATMWDQIALAQASLFIYVMLPVVDEYFIEQGWTFVYFTLDEIGGWAWFALYFVLYMTLVEIGIYWMHRKLHTNKWLYKHVHMLHHKYNKPETLTPWASIAFHPADGILQASPYVASLFLVPCHYLTHLFLLFFTAVWATYIHDSMDWNMDPIMGSKYHTVHHTHYIYNYGQIFTFCDRIFGTLRVPEAPTGLLANKKQS